jgi:predicted dehydrogenase
VLVVGSKGVAELGDSYDDHILRADGIPDGSRGASGKPCPVPIGKEMPLRRELKAFLEHLDGGPAPMSSAAEGLMTVERIAAIRAMAGL